MYRNLSTLFSLFSLSTALPSCLLARDDNPGCQAASTNDFTWTVEQFDYHASYIFTTPAHQNSWGYVNFSLTNPALTYKAACSGSSSQLSDFFYGTVPYECTFPEGTPKSSRAKFYFNRPSGLLNITSSWSCSDQDPRWPVTFGAAGSAVLDLQCSDTTWQNPNWTTPGDIYSSRQVQCTPIDFKVKPYEMTAVA